MIIKKRSMIAILAVLAIALIAGCTGSESAVKNGDNVSIDYIVWLGDNATFDNGSIYDTSYETLAQQTDIYYPGQEYAPMSYVIGSNAIKGFDDHIPGMKVGESRNFTLDQPFGPYNASLILPVPMSMFEGSNIQPYPNETLSYNFKNVRVDHIVNESGNKTVYIDFNDPLAGKILNFMVTVRGIK